MEGIAHGVGAAGAGRDRAGAHALQAEADGHLGRRHVGNGHGHEVGADLLHAFFLAAGVLLLDGGQPADAAGQDDAGGFGVGFGIKAAVLDGFGCGSQCQQGKAGHLAGLFFVHDSFRVKALHLSRQFALEPSGIELGDGGNAALSGLCGGPALGHGVAQRVHSAQTGNDHSAFFHENVLLYIAMPPSTQSTCPVR